MGLHLNKVEAASGATSPVPANWNFEAPANQEVGTPPTNYDFGSGGTGWTKTGSGTVTYTGGYAQLSGSSPTYLTSSTFTLDAYAEQITVTFKATSGRNFVYFLLYNASGGQILADTLVDCNPCSQTAWTTKSILLPPSSPGASVYIKFQKSYTGTFQIDDAGLQYDSTPQWIRSSGGNNYSIQSDDAQGNYLKFVAGHWKSQAFTLISDTAELDYAYEGTGSHYIQFIIRKVSDNSQIGYADGGSSCSCSRAWTKLVATINAGNAGQAVYIHIQTTGTSPIYIDNAMANSWGTWARLGFPSLKSLDPVDVGSGQFTHSHTDVAVPGKGVPLEFTRSYQSASYLATDLGRNWRHNYAGSLYIYSNSSVRVFYPSGGSAYFAHSSGTFTAESGVFDLLVKNGDNTYTLTTVTAAKYNFSTAGKLTSIVDRNGWTTTITYDGSGFIDEVEDAGGRILDFTTDGSGRITEIEDPLGRTVDFDYDANNDLVEVTDVKGGTTTYEYSSHRMTSLTDSNAHLQNENIYDAANRVVEQTDAIGGKACIYYGSAPSYTSAACTGPTNTPAAGQTVTVDPRGLETIYDFDTRFRTTSVTDQDGNFTSFTLDSSDNRTCVTDPLGHKTGFTYDSLGNVTHVIDAENTDTSCALKSGGVQSTFAYTAKNDIDLETDPLGRQTDYVYDANGNLTDVIRKDASSNVKLRTCLTRPTSGTNEGLVTEIIESTTLTNCTGNTTKFEYDSYGNQTAVIDARFSSQGSPPKTEIEYDLGGRRETVTNELGHTTTFTYDEQNNVLTAEDGLGNLTKSTYDAKGNLLTVTDANREAVSTAESGAACGSAGTGDGDDDDSDTVIDDGCPSVIYAYDNADRLTSVVDALGHQTTYGYDANGNRTSVTNANRQAVSAAESGAACGSAGTGDGDDDDSDTVIDDGCPSVIYAYDNLNQLESQTDALGNVWSYEYDVAGRLETRTDAKSQVTTYGYSDRNQLTSIDYPVGTSDVSFDYDEVGNRIEMVDGTGTTTYTPDALNRLSSVAFPGSRIVGYTYDAVGNRETVTYPGGSDEVTYGYDEANNLTSVTDWNSQVTAYDYDDAGLLETVTLPSGTGIVGAYGYDNADRLTSIDWVKGGSTTVASVDYTLDAAGNRLTKNGDDYTYDAADRLSAVEGVSYSFDENGNQTDRGADSFDWDAEDRLTSATVSSATTTFIYNGDGLRDSLTFNSVTTTSTWDVATSIPQVLDDETLKYVYGLGRISQVGASATYYYLADGLGSTMALVDSTGTVVNTYDYDVFGAVRGSTGSQSNEFKFTGEQADSSTGMEYLRARYYNVDTGQLLSRDPLSFQSTWSGQKYQFANSDPINFTDPLGLDPDDDRRPPPVAIPITKGERQCQEGWNHCRQTMGFGILQDEFNSGDPHRIQRAIQVISDVCKDFLNMCLNKPSEGFQFRAAAQRMQHAIEADNTSLYRRLLTTLKAPFTGSGGLLSSRGSKEGRFNLCR
ncbi:MAG TPA: RHS repeat-associated core domain-containing protein [Dehalococcoidia bacterium]|nr:RHS repeat-associated core domain-containing protein [Dehalococcoidia bacterium]